jgi:two-component system OmpR family response regulator
MKTIILLAGSDDDRRMVRPWIAAPGMYAIVESPASGYSLIECLRLDPDLIVACAVADVVTIRQETKSPILAVGLLEPAQQMLAMRAGADDYSSNIEEVTDKIAALLELSRRRRPVCAAGFRLDPRTRRVTSHNASVRLTTNEFAVLEVLMRSAGKIVPRQVLLRDALGLAGPNSPRALEVHVSRLRKKLGYKQDLIRSVRGSGYVFVDGEVVPAGRTL